jgi:hypothetical protein
MKIHLIQYIQKNVKLNIPLKKNIYNMFLIW